MPSCTLCRAPTTGAAPPDRRPPRASPVQRSPLSVPAGWTRLSRNLQVSQPGDADEREADRAADAVLGGAPARISSRPTAGPAVQRMCARCEEEAQQVHASRESDAAPAPGFDPSPAGPGQGLPGHLRSGFEPAYGQRFDQVRVHTDAESAHAAAGLAARAYTIGNHIVFGAGQYDPDSRTGQRLIAHELAHVVQQSSTGAPAVQRKPIGGPLDLQPDVCVQVPWLSDPACASKAADICSQYRSLPGCDQVCKIFDCKKPDQPSANCPLGWHGGRTADFKGQCCRDGIVAENDRDCCAPSRVAWKDSRCCASGEIVVDGHCTKDRPPVLPSLLCAPGRRTLLGECCEPPLVSDGLHCVPPVAPKPKPTDQPRPVPPTTIDILFKFDRPKPGEPVSALPAATTAAGQAQFDALVAALGANPALKVQLTGRASPPGTEPYNLELGTRRARMVALALAAAGVGGSRLGEPADVGVGEGCRSLGDGLASCGETGATGAADQEVRAVVFQP